MKTMTILGALFLALAPAVSFASCSGGHEARLSCADGKIWDDQAGACVAPTG